MSRKVKSPKLPRKPNFKKYLRLFISVFFCLVFFITHLKTQFIGLEHFDEGIRLFAAVNILNGKLPYRDFVGIYPPGFFLLTAAVFKIFGVTLYNYRLEELILQSIIAGLSVYLSAEGGMILFGILTGILLIIFPTEIALGSFLFIFASYISFLKFIDTRNKLYFFISGLSAGLSSFFRIDFAFYSIVSLTITYCSYLFLSRYKSQSLKKIISVYTRELPVFVSGIILGLIPILVFMMISGWNNSLTNLLIDSFRFTQNRSLPFPPLIPYIGYYLLNYKNLHYSSYFLKIIYGCIFYLPAFTAVTILSDSLIRNKEYKPRLIILVKNILLSVSILVFYLYLHYRPDIEHAWPIYYLTFILLPAFFVNLHNLINKFRWPRMILFILLLLIASILRQTYFFPRMRLYISLTPFILILLYICYKPKLNLLKLFSFFLILIFFIENLLLLEYYRTYRSVGNYPKDLISLDIPRGQGIFVSRIVEENYLNLMHYLLSLNKKGDTVFIGSNRHDRIFINDILLYFLTGFGSPTGYWWYEPGRQSSEPIQQEMVSELEKSKPKYTVIWALASISNEPNMSSHSSGVFILDDYIKKNYIPDKQFGYYFVLRRK